MILLYADDPGAANYLAPLPPALAADGLECELVLDASLSAYAADRSIPARIRPEGVSPDELLAGVALLVAGTSENRDCFGNRLIDSARARRVTSLGAVDMAVNARGRFQGASDDPMRHAPDYLAVPDAAGASAFSRLGYPADRIFLCGHPHFDEVRNLRRTFLGQDRQAMRRAHFPEAPADRPVWLFLAEGVDRLNPGLSYRDAGYTLNGRGDSDFRACIVLEEILDAARANGLDPWIVLRLHPKSELADFDPVRREIAQVSAGGNPLPLVWAADLTVGMSTMLLQEAYLLARPHLSVLPKEVERSWLYALEAGLTPCVWTPGALREKLGLPVEPPPEDGNGLPRDCVRRTAALIRRLTPNHNS